VSVPARPKDVVRGRTTYEEVYTMLSLIAREIRDNIVSVALPCLASALGITLAIIFALSRANGGAFPVTIMFTPILLLAFCSLGVSQAYGDRANRISSLLATLGITRNRIFAARVLAGLLIVLVCLVPLVVTTILLLWRFAPPLEFYGRMVVEISLTVFLAAVACYFAGLLVGWTTSKAWLLAGSVLLLLSLVSLVVIKGFGLGAMALLLLFIGATLWYAWHTFTSASL